MQEIVDVVENHKYSTIKAHNHIRFKVSAGEKYEDIMTYDQIVSKTEQEMDTEIFWKFNHITAHEGPLAANHRKFKGSSYNIMVEWEDGEITGEPLSIIVTDNPVTSTIYACENNLLELEGWMHFKHIAKRQKKMYT